MNKILFVAGPNDRHWIQALRQSALDMNKFLVLMDYCQMEEVSYRDYELIVLDASITVDLVRVIMNIRASDPRARVVVVSSAPHWKQARETLLAGAIDYVRKMDTQAAILDFLRDNLSKTMPARKLTQNTILLSAENGGA